MNGESLEEWGLLILVGVVMALGAVLAGAATVAAFSAHWLAGTVTFAAFAGVALMFGGMWLQDRRERVPVSETKEGAA